MECGISPLVKQSLPIQSLSFMGQIVGWGLGSTGFGVDTS
jgi:hypothetical protein